jgi:hypothetical protein
MMSRRKDAPKRSMRKCIAVFCEGQTEETYVSMLKGKYRLPIQIIPRITGTAITPECVEKHIRQIKLSKADKVTPFFLYDLDRADINVKLKSCGKILLGSCPCIEGWFILHEKPTFTSSDSDACVGELKSVASVWKKYSKGTLTEGQKEVLWKKRLMASQSAQKLSSAERHTTVYLLINELEKEKTEVEK